MKDARLLVGLFLVALALFVTAKVVGQWQSVTWQRHQRQQQQALCDLHGGIPVFDTRGEIHCAAINQPVQSMKVR